MTPCEQFEMLLAEGDAASLHAAGQHALSCAACSAMLKRWNEISAVAPSLHATWENDLLWPRIERSVNDQRRASRSGVWQIAAAIVLAVGLAAGSWYGLHVREDHAAFDQAILRDRALVQVQDAEKAHVAAIENLERVANPKLERPNSPLMVSYKEKLMLLDDAIRECQTGIDQNRHNAHLRRQLLSMYSEKQRTLQDVLQEDAHVSNH